MGSECRSGPSPVPSANTGSVIVQSVVPVSVTVTVMECEFCHPSLLSLYRRVVDVCRSQLAPSSLSTLEVSSLSEDNRYESSSFSLRQKSMSNKLNINCIRYHKKDSLLS